MKRLLFIAFLLIPEIGSSQSLEDLRLQLKGNNCKYSFQPANGNRCINKNESHAGRGIYLNKLVQDCKCRGDAVKCLTAGSFDNKAKAAALSEYLDTGTSDIAVKNNETVKCLSVAISGLKEIKDPATIPSLVNYLQKPKYPVSLTGVQPFNYPIGVIEVAETLSSFGKDAKLAAPVFKQQIINANESGSLIFSKYVEFFLSVSEEKESYEIIEKLLDNDNLYKFPVVKGKHIIIAPIILKLQDYGNLIDVLATYMNTVSPPRRIIEKIEKLKKYFGDSKELIRNNYTSKAEEQGVLLIGDINKLTTELEKVSVKIKKL